MKFLLPVMLPVFLISCSSPALISQEPSAWDSLAYKGFSSKISRLAGVDAVNCGVINQVHKDDPINNGATINASRSCIKTAIAEGTPFKFGTVSIPTDSYLFEAIVYTPSKEYWIVQYDYMIDGSDNQHFIKN